MATMILAEGGSDDKFLKRLIAIRKLKAFAFEADNIARNGKRGFEGRLRSLRTKGDLENKSAILIVADNDDDPAKAFADIQAQIRSAENLGVPDKPRQLAPSTAPLPAVAVLMMPWDNVAGCLETLCYQASSKKWPRNGQCVEEFIKCAGIGGWAPQSVSKARMNGMIASICEEDPATSMQYVWNRKQDIVPVDDPCFNQIANYLATF